MNYVKGNKKTTYQTCSWAKASMVLGLATANIGYCFHDSLSQQQGSFHVDKLNIMFERRITN